MGPDVMALRLLLEFSPRRVGAGGFPRALALDRTPAPKGPPPPFNILLLVNESLNADGLDPAFRPAARLGPPGTWSACVPLCCRPAALLWEEGTALATWRWHGEEGVRYEAGGGTCWRPLQPTPGRQDRVRRTLATLPILQRAGARP